MDSRTGVIVVLCLVLAGVSATRWHAPAHAPDRLTRVAYVFGSVGEFVELDLKTGRSIAHWWLSRIAGLADTVPPYSPPSARTTDGSWAPVAAVADAAGNTLFLAVPTTADGTGENAAYRILALDTPTLNLKGAIPVPAQPSLFVSRSSLYVNYPTESSETRLAVRLETYDVRSLARTKQYDQAVDTQAYMRNHADLPTFLDKHASILPAGDVIIDRGRRVVVRGAALASEPFNPLAMLTPEQRKLLQPYEQVDPVSKRTFLPLSFAAAAATRAVYRVGHAKTNQMGVVVVVVDAIATRVLSLFEAPFGELRLTTDGRFGIVEEHELRRDTPPGEGASTAAFNTGRLARYDLESGTRAGQLTHPALSGRSTVHTSVCVGDADDPTVFASESDLLLIDWQGTPRVRRTAAFLPDAALATCVFAAQ